MSKGLAAVIGTAIITVVAMCVGPVSYAASSPPAPRHIARHHHAEHVCQTPVPSGATWHVVNDGASLLAWANAHAYGSVSNIMSMTIQCGPGIQQLGLAQYLDGANLRAPLPKGTILWVPPFGYTK